MVDGASEPAGRLVRSQSRLRLVTAGASAPRTLVQGRGRIACALGATAVRSLDGVHRDVQVPAAQGGDQQRSKPIRPERRDSCAIGADSNQDKTHMLDITQPSCSARTSTASLARLARPAKTRSPSSTSRSFRSLENERKTIQIRTEELQSRRNSLSEADRHAQGQGPSIAEADAVMAQVGQYKTELENSAARLDQIQAEAGRAAAGRAQPAARERAGRRRRGGQRRAAPLGPQGGYGANPPELSRPGTMSHWPSRSGLDFETAAKLSARASPS